MNDRVRFLGLSKLSHEIAHATQIELFWRIAKRPGQTIVDEAIQIIQGGLILLFYIHSSGIVTG